jgi:hypothetical protein
MTESNDDFDVEYIDGGRAVTAQAGVDSATLVEVDGNELAMRVAEQWDGFWNQNEADKASPVRKLTRAEIRALGYQVTQRG